MKVVKCESSIVSNLQLKEYSTINYNSEFTIMSNDYITIENCTCMPQYYN